VFHLDHNILRPGHPWKWNYSTFLFYVHTILRASISSEVPKATRRGVSAIHSASCMFSVMNVKLFSSELPSIEKKSEFSQRNLKNIIYDLLSKQCIELLKKNL